jgi:hypothetical protein
MTTGIAPPDVFPLNYPKGDPTLPERGAKAVPVILDWNKDNEYSVSLLQVREQKFFGSLRCIWIDASECTQSITVAVNGTEQIFNVPAGSANYYAVVNLNVPVVTFVVPVLKAEQCRILFLNFQPSIAMGSQLALTGSVIVDQGTSPWIISGAVQAAQSGAWNVGVNNFPAVQPISGAVTANQGTSPWIVQNIETDIVVASNSTTVPLGANATFTGAAFSTLGYKNVRVLVNSNVSSATAGIFIEFSSDGISWIDSSPFTFTAGLPAPNQGQSFIAGVRGAFARVVYTNGAVAQASFQLSTTLSVSVIGGDVLSINGTVNDNNHGFLTVSQIVGKTTAGGGGYIPVKVNPSGTLTVDASNSTNVGVTQGTSPWNIGLATSMGMASTSTTATSATWPATATRLCFVQIDLVNVVGPAVNIKIDDGGGNRIITFGIPAYGTAAQSFGVLRSDALGLTLNNGGSAGRISLTSNLTSGLINFTFGYM